MSEEVKNRDGPLGTSHGIKGRSLVLGYGGSRNKTSPLCEELRELTARRFYRADVRSATVVLFAAASNTFPFNGLA